VEECPTRQNPHPEHKVVHEHKEHKTLPVLPGAGIMQKLGKLLPASLELETEDLILMLILYLMYRESGDSELLIIMGAMFLL